ncbi:MAG: hypothetical protein JO372_09440, partial [Solirubrobacterales bacterium]|nr:hypothetical protein [Solirubrobacterales bacterium]
MATSIALALAVAELGRRLLMPRDPPPEPPAIDLQRYFSPEEIARGARFARPQLALALARGAVDLGALVLVVVAPPKLPERRWGLSGAAVGAGLSVALSLPSLPLAAISRQRAISVGLATQSWRGWAGDLVKATAIKSAL